METKQKKVYDGITVEDLEKHENELVNIADRVFEFFIEPFNGPFAVFSERDNEHGYYFYATPNWEGDPVTVQLECLGDWAYDAYQIDVQGYDKIIYTWEEYVRVVRILAERMIRKYEAEMSKVCPICGSVETRKTYAYGRQECDNCGTYYNRYIPKTIKQKGDIDS